MKLVIRCFWSPAADCSLNERIAEAGALFLDPAFTAPLGTQWYRTGRSRKQALSRPAVTSELGDIKRWSKSPFVGDDWMYCLSLWNGLDDWESAGISFTLFAPANQPPPSDHDRVVISGPGADSLRSRGVRWETVLSCARQLALKLGGVADVTSHELRDLARSWQLKEPDDAAYAAFWGIDRSGRNPQYDAAKQAGLEPPFEKVVCHSWDELKNPSRSGVTEIIDLLKTPGRTEANGRSS